MDQGFLNAGLVEIFLIENPGFLDEFVKVHVTKDRIQAWLDTKLLAEAAIEDIINYGTALHPPPTTTTNLPRPMERAMPRPVERPMERAMPRPVDRTFEKTLERGIITTAIDRVIVPQIENTLPSVSEGELKPVVKKRTATQRGKRMGALKHHRCQDCNKDFESESKLQRHLRVHTGQRPFVCKVCGKSFTQSNNLKEHLTIHNENRELYKCEECGKNFTRKRHLQRHQQIHSGVMRFQCNLCDKRFNYKYSLNIHLNVHTGEKKFQCDLCDKRFTEPSNLKRHVRTHTKEKTKSCDLCEKSFVSTSDLKRHRMTHDRASEKDGKTKKGRLLRKRRGDDDKIEDDQFDKDIGESEENVSSPPKQRQRRKRKPRQGLKLSDLNDQESASFLATAEDVDFPDNKNENFNGKPGHGISEGEKSMSMSGEVQAQLYPLVGPPQAGGTLLEA